MSWFQKQIRIEPKSRGFHLVTREVMLQLPELRSFQVGLAHLFMQHTSASLSINENADPTVRIDMESHFNEMVPENSRYYLDIYEGPDDMPAHIKASLLGNSLSIPITDGHFNLGTWQGIYLCEHRDHAGGRQLLITLQGE